MAPEDQLGSGLQRPGKFQFDTGNWGRYLDRVVSRAKRIATAGL